MGETGAAIRWGIIGPGRAARAFAAALERTQSGRLVAIGTREPDRPGLPEAFAGARIHAGYDALLADPEVQAVYIANLNPHHAEWAIRAAHAGKHALVEKPFAMNAREAEAMFAAAEAAGTFMAEAFMFRPHPQTARLVELIAAGAIGELRLIRTSLGVGLPFDPAARVFNHQLGGGAILDVGCYLVSMVRLLAGAASGKPFADPAEVKGVAHFGAERTDEWTGALMKFDSGLVADLTCSLSVWQDNVLRLFGTTGRIEVQDFWIGSGRQGGTGRIRILRGKDEEQVVEIAEPGWLFSFEAEAAATAIAAGEQELKSVPWADTLGNMRTLDRWREDIELRYDFE